MKWSNCTWSNKQKRSWKNSCLDLDKSSKEIFLTFRMCFQMKRTNKMKLIDQVKWIKSSRSGWIRNRNKSWTCSSGRSKMISSDLIYLTLRRRNSSLEWKHNRQAVVVKSPILLSPNYSTSKAIEKYATSNILNNLMKILSFCKPLNLLSKPSKPNSSSQHTRPTMPK